MSLLPENLARILTSARKRTSKKRARARDMSLAITRYFFANENVLELFLAQHREIAWEKETRIFSYIYSRVVQWTMWRTRNIGARRSSFSRGIKDYRNKFFSEVSSLFLFSKQIMCAAGTFVCLFFFFHNIERGRVFLASAIFFRIRFMVDVKWKSNDRCNNTVRCRHRLVANLRYNSFYVCNAQTDRAIFFFFFCNSTIVLGFTFLLENSIARLKYVTSEKTQQ